MRAKPLVFGNRLPRRVTALRITPLGPSLPGPSMSEFECPAVALLLLLSSLSERWRSFVPKLRLSRLDWTCCLVSPVPKYPLPAFSTLFRTPGDNGPGEGLELFMLTLLELCWLFPLRIRALLKLIKFGWKLMRLACAGEGWLFIHSSPGLFMIPGIIPLLILDAAGVLRMASSTSRSTAISSEEESESESESDPNILTLLTELDKFVFSFDKEVHNVLD